MSLADRVGRTWKMQVHNTIIVQIYFTFFDLLNIEIKWHKNA